MGTHDTPDVTAGDLDHWKFQEAVDNAGHAIIFTDLEGTIEYVNPAFEGITGYAAEEVLGETPAILKSGEHDESDYEDLWETITAGEVWEGELVNEGADGERFVVEQTIAPIPREGRNRGYVAINTDITEKREREQKIEALHTATRNLLAVDDREAVAMEIGRAVEAILEFPINVVRLREGDQLAPIHVNERTRELLGERPAYAPGETPAGRAFERGDAIVHDDVRQLDDAFDRGPVRSWLYVPIGEFGVISVGETRAGAFDEHDVQLVSILANNAATAFTVLEHERDLERENERLERFASTVSHDLRNPLQAAELTLEEMREFTDQLDRMTKAHQRMEEVIEGVLTLAKQGERVEDPAPIALGELAQECWEYIAADGTELVVDSPDGGLTIQADPDRLKHLLENLFRNAVTHGDAGTIRIGPLDGGGFSVADDGEGIPPDEREAVLETGYTTATEGTGLGLSIVREIAEAHGWHLAITDGREGGARFEFTPEQFASEAE